MASGSLDEKIVPLIHDLSQITFIYIFCADTSKHKVWTEKFNKIRDVCNDDDLLSIKIKQDVYFLSNASFPFGLFDPDQRTLQDLTKDQGSFMCYHSLTEILLRLPQTSEAKAEMITECRTNYEENEVQLEKITLFEETYEADNAIKWYTDNAFVFQLFNKAFRKQDFNVIFKYRYFLVDVHNQLNSLYKQQYKNQKRCLTRYRGQLMYRDELMKLKQNIDNLISVNTFFSTSESCNVATDFSGNGEQESIGIVSVIFEITVDLEVPCAPFADISEISTMRDERETLFSIGTVFRIRNVELTFDTIWFMKLVWTKDCNEKFKGMKQLISLLNFYIGQNIGDHPSILAFGLFVSKMGLLHQALSFYMFLRKILFSDHPDRAVWHNNIGEVLRKLSYYNRARYNFELAFEYGVDVYSFYHPFWVTVHSNIALLELSINRPKQALKSYRCALFIIFRWEYRDDWETVHHQEILATIYHGMGSAHVLLNQYQNASELYQKALQIELYILPCDHPTLIGSYYNLGKVKVGLSAWTKALKNFEESLRIAQLDLLVKDWRFLTLHINIALIAYCYERNLSKTLSHCAYAEKFIKQSVFPLISRNRIEVYKTLACIYVYTYWFRT